MGSTDAPSTYSAILGARELFSDLIQDDTLPLSPEIRACAKSVKIHGSEEEPTIPTPWKETEAITAFKALEASVAIALGKLRFGIDQTGTIDSGHATTFLFMNYLSTIDGYGKWDPRSIARLKRELRIDYSFYPMLTFLATDLFEAQSNIYRRLSSNVSKII